jgi:hypothetical protein
MAKFSNTKQEVKRQGPVKTKEKATVTHEGGNAVKFEAQSELFLLAITNMVGENTFYEKAGKKDDRFVKLVHKITKSDPTWIERFIPYLRNTMNMRSASIVMAAEYAAAGGPRIRQVVDSAMSRADEPAEFLAYWMQNHYGWDGMSYPLPSPKLPQGVRKGLQDAATRLYKERSVLKYNGLSRGVAMGNVLDLVHPKPKDDYQSLLFKFIIDRHHGNKVNPEGLAVISEFNRLNSLDPAKRREVLETPEVLNKAGMTWEALSGWLGGPMDSKAWEAMIEAGMGYMALLRNLRNFDQVKISKKYQKLIIEKLTNPEEVASSRQFPFRFYSAYKAAPSLTWGPALEEALDLSTRNIPEFGGTTEVLVDLSGSMTAPISANSSVQNWEVGAVFGAALAIRQGYGNVNFIGFGTGSEEIRLPQGGSVLKAVDSVAKLMRSSRVGHGTNIWGSVERHFDNHDRVVIFTDMQTHDNSSAKGKKIKTIHAFDLGGYGRTPFSGKTGRYHYGGYSDATMVMMKALEQHQSAAWPF